MQRYLRPNTPAILLSTLALIALVVTGCGRAGDGKVEVSGNVVFDGQPITSGDIRFVPDSRKSGSVAGSQIVNGNYQLQGKQAILPGSYRVEVTGYQNSDGSPGPVDRADPEADYVQYVPGKYNTESELRFTLAPDSPAKVTHDLPLDK